MRRAVREYCSIRVSSRKGLLASSSNAHTTSNRLEDSLFVCYKFKKMLKLSVVVEKHFLAIETKDDVVIKSDIEYEDTDKTLNEDNLVDEGLEI